MRCLMDSSVMLVAPVTCRLLLVSSRPPAWLIEGAAADDAAQFTIQPSAVYCQPDVPAVSVGAVPRCHTSMVALRNLLTMPPGPPMVMVEPDAEMLAPSLAAMVSGPDRPLSGAAWSITVHLLAVLDSMAR